MAAAGATGSGMPALPAEKAGRTYVIYDDPRKARLYPASSLRWAEIRCCTCSMLLKYNT